MNAKVQQVETLLEKMGEGQGKIKRGKAKIVMLANRKMICSANSNQLAYRKEYMSEIQAARNKGKLPYYTSLSQKDAPNDGVKLVRPATMEVCLRIHSKRVSIQRHISTR